ncbi:hypothetical protein ACFQWB_15550 [Paenibacillus thermoaerophilus]|uniref:DUF2768 domain-containing protein n=1 Tax=Paenibacillus thermoaerophilus TaxID=1215385 RepID=A0ABW2V5C0_9BACL|nr:hypothetical protein [Paenibacillus thermoaerophilus]
MAHSSLIAICILCALAFAGVVLLKREEIPQRLRRFLALAAVAAVSGSFAIMIVWLLTA